MGVVSSSEPFRLHGRFTLRTFRDGLVSAERTADNILCAAGLSVLVTAVNWSAVEDQNGAMGNPFSITYLAPILGALGSGSGTPAATDTALFSELSYGDYTRQVVSAAGTTAATGSNPGSIVWEFFFPTTAEAWTITECGVFVTATTSSGSLFDHAIISPSVTKPAGETALLQIVISLGN
jgi:hypothetical protein